MTKLSITAILGLTVLTSIAQVRPKAVRDAKNNDLDTLKKNYKAQEKAIKDKDLGRDSTKKLLSILKGNNADQTQFVEETADVKIRKFRLDKLLKQAMSDDADLVTSDNLTKSIQSTFRSVSGTEIKNGKYFGSSASLDAKSITVNISFKPSKNHEFYILPTIGASAKDNFVTVLTGDKYSRTFTGGLNFILPYWNNTFEYEDETFYSLHNDLRSKTRKYNVTKCIENIAFFRNKIIKLKDILHNDAFLMECYRSNSLEDNDIDKLKDDLTDYKVCVDTLTGAHILRADFNKLDIPQQTAIVDGLYNNGETRFELASDRLYLDELDKLQQKAAFSVKSVKWFTSSMKYNQGNYLVADPNAKNLTSGARDEYISISGSFNMISLRSNGSRWYSALTLNYSNGHNMVSATQIHAEAFKSYLIGAATVQQISNDLTFYEAMPGRLIHLSAELPFAHYSTQRLIGWEVAFQGAIHDPSDDNLSFRAGALIPIGAGDKNQLMIEPLVRFQKLNEAINHFKDKITFGINLSITIPKSVVN